ncbi:MAG: hypothetical protein LUF87_04880 [Alistipes sp.]|nr:hypothetical protein [Alistipes sp.]
MEDNIFKPLTHMDREGYDENLVGRFQRRNTTPVNDTVLENLDTDPINPQEGWDPDSQVEEQIAGGNNIEANGCWCPTDDEDGPVVYSETVVVEFFDDGEDGQ